MTSSIYIHIPFCRSICSYCDFCKLFYNEKFVDNYLEALYDEVKQNYKGELIKTLYIGGGTPSCLSLKQLERLFEIIKLFNLDTSLEFSFEANVSDITIELLSFLKKNKVNRLSIGIETVNEKYMPFLNRYNSKDLVIEKINLVKDYFDNFNLDLMYAFPNQTVEEVLEDLSFVVSLKPKHISIYSLIIEEHTKIYIDGVKPIDDELEESMYYAVTNYLKDASYKHYEISNFSLEGYESKHNLVYWNNNEYYGFGLGASGFVSNIRYTNSRNIINYNKGNYLYEKEELTKKINMENELILGLRKIEGISKSTFRKKFSLEIESVFDIINLVGKKYLVEDNDRLYIPEDKLYISNSILVNFIGGSNDE